jgi:nitrate/nitrite transporter NarK
LDSPGGAGHIPLVFAGFILFNLLMNAGPNSTTFTLAPILFPTHLRGTASGFAAGVAKIGATLGVFVLPTLKGKFGVPAVLGMMAVVSVLGLIVTLVFGERTLNRLLSACLGKQRLLQRSRACPAPIARQPKTQSDYADFICN